MVSGAFYAAMLITFSVSAGGRNLPTAKQALAMLEILKNPPKGK
jgi:hypothetical protein